MEETRPVPAVGEVARAGWRGPEKHVCILSKSYLCWDAGVQRNTFAFYLSPICVGIEVRTQFVWRMAGIQPRMCMTFELSHVQAYRIFLQRLGQ